LEDLNTKSLLLDISNNLSRIGKFGLAGNIKRTHQFIRETEQYVAEAQNRDLSESTLNILLRLQSVLEEIESEEIFDKYAADDAFTYSSILMHKAMAL
jgi:hypothetical protein